MPGVKLKNLTKVFRDKERKVIAVKNLNLEIKNGEFFVLLGPSGCGKTTTLRMIAGLEKPTNGEIYIGNQLVNDIPPADRDIAMVFQSYAIYPHLTVYENIAFPLRVRRRKMSKKEVERRVKEVAKMLQIESLLNAKPSQLSGGQAQRVALARAIVRRPKVFLMDEPLSNLDAKLRVMARAYLKRLQRNLGITTIYVTHDQIEAMTMADRVAVLNAGELQQVGSPEELFEKPANTFVAGFIGSPPMNLIEGLLIEHDGKVFFKNKNLEIAINVNRDIIEKYLNKEVILGIRPENIYLDNKGIPAKVILAEPLGNRYIIHSEIGDNLVIRLEIGKKQYASLGLKDSIKISFDRDKILLFDKHTEKIIL